MLKLIIALFLCRGRGICRVMETRPKENAVPFAAHTPIPIPHYWKDEVKRQLEKDIEMGIIRRAPIGEPTEWCMRMVTVSKKDGTPRRTIDFQPINKYCERETHYTPRPFDVVSNIPPNSYKTVLDAYNGYHQVPLDEEVTAVTAEKKIVSDT